MKISKQLPLGKITPYIDRYAPELLFPIARKDKRREIGINTNLPFSGVDIWNGFEISWLNTKGKPEVALGQFIIACNSANLIESKSFKLYLNSFNNTQIESLVETQSMMQRDLSVATKSEVEVILTPLQNNPAMSITDWQHAVCLDKMDITCDTYTTNPNFLSVDSDISVKNEVLCSNLLKSNCLVTGQPDWGSVKIIYSGQRINHEGLLKYIVSFRNHNEFHEQCIERMFVDIQKHCNPNTLSVEARYTRRGGLDINPFRSSNLNKEFTPSNLRLVRQ